MGAFDKSEKSKWGMGVIGADERAIQATGRGTKKECIMHS